MVATLEVPACPACGSLDISKDATAGWNRMEQDWEIIGTQDNCTCEACGWSGDNPKWVQEP